MSMPHRLIIELNRCFEPNAFNTGPSLTALIAAQKAKEAQAKLAHDQTIATNNTFSSVEEVLSEFDIPDLTASPASSISTLSSLPLEDEEIKKIFSNPDPAYDAPMEMSPLLLDSSPSLDFIRRDSVDITTLKKDELNPHAAPFIPSFTPSNFIQPLNALFTPPFEVDHADERLIPPLNVDYFAPSPPKWCLVPEEDMQIVKYDEAPLVISSPYIQSTTLAPLYPPGLPHPLHKALEFDSQAEAVAKAATPPPVYLPLLVDALNAKTTPRERGVLLGVIFDPATCYIDWNYDSLLGLVENMFTATFGSDAKWTTDPNTLVGDAGRYVNRAAVIKAPDEGEEEETREGAFAAVAQELHNQLNEKLGEEYGKTFAWHLREILLGKFLGAWDTTKTSAITFHANPPSDYVHSSLSLCRAIGAVFQRGTLWREHVDLCLRGLLKDLISVEHLEALALIVLGCGKTFWDPPASLLIAPPGNVTVAATDAVSATNALPNASPRPDSSPKLEEMTERARYALTTHVANFLDALEGNVVRRGLTDASSVLGQPWGVGQLEVRVQEIVGAVKGWEADFLTMIHPATETAALT